MKASISKMWRSGLAMLMVLCMVVGLFPAAAFATEIDDETITIDGEVYTVAEVKELIKAAADDVAENYDVYYAEAYTYAKDNGYIELADEYIQVAIDTLKNLDLSEVEMTAEFKAQLDATIEEVVETLVKAQALVKEADVLDQATLDALIATLDEAGETMQNLLVLVEQGIDDSGIVEATIEALNKLENEIIPAIVEKLGEAVDYGTELLMEKIHETYDALVKALVAFVKEAAPEVADWVYNWLYNNPDKVIAFFNEYGDEMVDFLAEYGDEIAAVISYIVANYGDKVAEYVLNNPEEVLKTMVEWLEVHGENTWALIDVYLEELGVYEEAGKLVEMLKQAGTEALEEAYKAVAEALAEKLAELKAELAALKAEVEELTEEIKAAIEKVEQAIADTEAVIEEIEQAIADLEAAVENMIEALNELYEALEKAEAEAAAKIAEIIDAFEAALYNATHADYAIAEDSYYVAIGDGSAVSESYVDALADELGVDVKNLAEEGTIEDAYAIIEANTAELAKADLVTVGYGNATFAQNTINVMMDALMDGETVEFDWADLITADGAEYVAQALAEIEAVLVEQGMDAAFANGVSVAEALTLAVEAYAYNAVSYAMNLPEVVNDIHAVSDALVVIVGMNNPFQGTVVEYNGVSLDLGEYVAYLVDAANLHGIVYAMLTENTIYVEASDAESNVTGMTLTMSELLNLYYGKLDCQPTADGHTYIKDQVLDALNIVTEEPALLGDADGNGVVNTNDAKMVLQYYTKRIPAENLNLSVCDVDGNDVVNTNDAKLILQFYTKRITKFPVEL